MNVTIPRHMLRSTHFGRDARVYDDSAIPSQALPTHPPDIISKRVLTRAPAPHYPQALAAKKEVIRAKRPDNLSVGKSMWNTSTLSENMARFPDRPMMRQLAQVS